MKRILKISLETLLIAAMLFASAVFLVPRVLGWNVGSVLSGSMTPKYPINTLLIAKPVNPQNIRLREIIEFHPVGETQLVSHRVVQIVKSGNQLEFRTKGDANNTPDVLLVPASRVTGRVIIGIPSAGRFVHFVHSKLGYAIFLLIPALYLMSGEILYIIREMRPKLRYGVSRPDTPMQMRYAKGNTQRANAIS